MSPSPISPPGIFPPISTIPPELLCYIFALTLAAMKIKTPPVMSTNDRGPRGWGYLGILGGPWLFGQVCSYWCELAESTPTLWTSFVLAPHMTGCHLRLLSMQLDRSGNSPLDLLIRFRDEGEPDWQGGPFDIFLAKLVALSARWRTLNVELNDNFFPHAEFAPLKRPGALPLLEELVFSGEPESRSYLMSIFNATCEFFKDATALRRVGLGLYARDWNLSLPWEQLTTYQGSLFDATTHFQNLVECDFMGSSFRNDDTRVRFLTLPHVRRLAVSDATYLDRLAAPALQSLCIVVNAPDGLVRVLHFLDRSGCGATLDELTLMFTVLSTPAEDIIAVLQQLQGLTALALELQMPHAPIVAALNASQRMCPKLRSLSWASPQDALDHGAFADMVLSRRGGSSGVHALRFLGVYFGRRRMKAAGWGRVIPGLTVITTNYSKRFPAVQRWRGDTTSLKALGLSQRLYVL
ncbi:hypothetical protein DFH06DRAFT_628005 [Mycena polygramma]|nr:hypothetical protein DFH06DRAFT_628005 [Mycena polygramma]